MELSRVQKIVKWFCSDRKFEQLMESSKKWKFTCKNCGQTSSIWDIGGIRGAAKGKPLTGIKCPHCQKFAMQRLYKEE